jgi:hypothetical protein
MKVALLAITVGEVRNALEFCSVKAEALQYICACVP